MINVHCSILLTLSMVANAGDYGLKGGSSDDQTSNGNNHDVNTNQHLSGRYLSNGGSYRFTPDNVATKAYRNLFYKNHQTINRINPNLVLPLNINSNGNNHVNRDVDIVKGINNRLRNGVNSILFTDPSSSVTKIASSVNTLTSTSSSAYSSTTIPMVTLTERLNVDPIVDHLIPMAVVEGRSSIDTPRSKVKPARSSYESFQDLFSNVTIYPQNGDKIIQDIYGDNVFNSQERAEQVTQMSKWMNTSPSADNQSGPAYSLTSRHQNANHQLLNDSMAIERIKIIPKSTNQTNGNNVQAGKRVRSKLSHQPGTINKPEALVSTSSSATLPTASLSSVSLPVLSPSAAASTSLKSSSTMDNNVSASEDDEAALMEDEDVSGSEASGTLKTPPCGKSGRHYCIFREDYPIKVVTEVTRYYKWPLEKLFRDLRNQVMPKLANDNYGGLVCDSITRVVRPGWARNTNNRWLVVINTDSYQQYVTEVLCRHGSGSYCNFIPPCYHATCRQRYNTQKLLVIDPWNPYKGPFLSEFLFPSCCICHVSDENLSTSRNGPTIKPDGRSKVDLNGPHSSGLVSEVSTEKVEL